VIEILARAGVSLSVRSQVAQVLNGRPLDEYMLASGLREAVKLMSLNLSGPPVMLWCVEMRERLDRFEAAHGPMKCFPLSDAAKTEYELREELHQTRGRLQTELLKRESLQREIDRALKVLDVSMPESGIEDAARQVKQAAISDRSNCEEHEALIRRLCVEVNEGECFDYEQGVCLWCHQAVSPNQGRKHTDACPYLKACRTAPHMPQCVNGEGCSICGVTLEEHPRPDRG